MAQSTQQIAGTTRIVVSTETTLSLDLRAFNICMFRTCNWPNPDRLYWGLARPPTTWSRSNCEGESYSHRGDRGVNGFFAWELSEWPSIRKGRMPTLPWSLGWSSFSRKDLTCVKRRKSRVTILGVNHFQKNTFRRAANASVLCPVQPGPYTVEQTVALPKEIPRGSSTPVSVSSTLLTESLPLFS